MAISEHLGDDISRYVLLRVDRINTQKDQVFVSASVGHITIKKNMSESKYAMKETLIHVLSEPVKAHLPLFFILLPKVLFEKPQ